MSSNASHDQLPTKSPSEWVIQRKSKMNVIVPASQPESNACFQDALAHTKNSGTSAMNASHEMLVLGNAKAKRIGLTTLAGRA